MSEQIVNPKLPKKWKKCRVKGCNNGPSTDPNIHYHNLPKHSDGFVDYQNYFGNIEKITRLKAWQMKLGIGDYYAKNYFICSCHFKPDDYFFTYAPGQKRYLKKTAVPSLNLPFKNKINTDRSTRLLKRKVENSSDVTENKIMKNQVNNDAVDSTTMQSFEECDVTNYLEVIMELPDNDKNSSAEITEINKILKKDAECSRVPVTREMLVQTDKLTVIGFIKTDNELSTMTGIQSFKLLDTISEILEKFYGTSEFENSKLDVRGKLILTYMKLKQNMSYSALAILFQCSAKHCQRIFSKTINMLSKALRDRDKQLYKKDSDQSWDVSKARVQVERSNQKQNCFQILSSSVPSELQPLLEDITIVLSGTINLSSSIKTDSNLMKDDVQTVYKSNDV